MILESPRREKPPPRSLFDRVLRECIEYYNTERVHTSIGDAPAGRPFENRPSEQAKIVGMPRVGGLHHRYTWAEAA